MNLVVLKNYSIVIRRTLLSQCFIPVFRSGPIFQVSSPPNQRAIYRSFSVFGLIGCWIGSGPESIPIGWKSKGCCY